MCKVSNAEKIRHLIHKEVEDDAVTVDEQAILNSSRIDIEVAKLSMSELRLALKQMAVSSVVEERRKERAKLFVSVRTTDLSELLDYAVQVLEERWEELEGLLLDSDQAEWQVDYAAQVIRGRWPEAEKLIFLNEAWLGGVAYAARVLETRWTALENKLLQDGHISAAIQYAADVIRGRWPELEHLLRTKVDDVTCEDLFKYAKEVIKARLPEELHNVMIAKGMMEGSHNCFRIYTTAKKFRRVHKPR